MVQKTGERRASGQVQVIPVPGVDEAQPTLNLILQVDWSSAMHAHVRLGWDGPWVTILGPPDVRRVLKCCASATPQ